jgi:chromosome partitioning protein
MKPSSRLAAHAQAWGAGSSLVKPPLTVSFVSQKGGVGKSTLARLFAVGAAHRGLKPLLADFDLDQLTCVEWSAIRLQHAVEPDIDARAFKSLKKLRKSEERAGIVVVDTRGLADELAQEVAEDSDVVFLPTGVSGDDLRPTLALARKLAKNGAEGRVVVVLSKVGRSEVQLQKAIETIEESGFELLSEHWPQRDGFQADLDTGRAGRESRNPYLREAAEQMEKALFARAQSAKPR